MIISQDIIFLSLEDKYLIYNFELNKACIVEERIKILIEECQRQHKYECFREEEISKKDIDILVKNGVLINNLDKYEKIKYKYRLINRHENVGISEVYLHLTQMCNLRCSYCYNALNLNKKDKLTTKLIYDIIDKLSEIGVKKIILTGGEPLLRKDIIQIVSYIKNTGIYVELLTNGVYLSAKSEILDFVDNIIVSLDTLEEDINQRKGLVINELIESLISISPKYKKKIAIRAVISVHNQNCWKDVEKFANEFGFAFITTIFIPNNATEFQLLPDFDKTKKNTELMNFGGSICGGCYKIIAIDSNGDIFPCQTLVQEEYKLTNILNDNWYNELKNAKLTKQFLDRTVLSINICKSCNYKYLCGGGCRAIAKKVYGNFDNHIEFLCKYQRELVEEKLRKVIEYYG